MSAIAETQSTTMYCANLAGDAWLKSQVDAARAFALNAIGCERVEGLILTGSLARGEASVLSVGEQSKLLGDVEFLLIVRGHRLWRQIRKRVTEMNQRATRILGSSASGFQVEFTPADISYLRRRCKPSMFAYDLRHHGRVIVGRRDLLDEIPPIERSAIPPDDAMETVLNRGLELVALQDSDAPDASVAYSVVKALLDLAGSALAFSGAYESRYSRRPAAFRALLEQRNDLCRRITSVQRLTAMVGEAARIKIEPTPAALERIAREVDPRSILRWLVELWRWEAGCLFGKPDSDLSALIRAYLAREKGAGLIRGWVKYVWHPLRPASAPLRPALLRLASTSSPRHLVYGAAVRAIDGAPGWEESVAGMLPVATHERESLLRKILETWKWLVRNN